MLASLTPSIYPQISSFKISRAPPSDQYILTLIATKSPWSKIYVNSLVIQFLTLSLVSGSQYFGVIISALKAWLVTVKIWMS